MDFPQLSLPCLDKKEVDLSVDECFQSVRVSPGILEIVRLAVACGAGDTGGPLSRRELALVQAAGPPNALAARRTKREIREGGDPLGDALCRARSTFERRKVGAYYTSERLLGPMIQWALDTRPERLVDPGCGSGRFSAAAAAENRNLCIISVDVDPVATLITRAALATVRAQNARVINGDYLTCDIPSSDGRTAYVGNPPYVRHHQLTSGTKQHAATLAARLGYKLSKLAGLHALFYLATLARHGKPGDVGSFVTSSEWLDVGYGSFVRKAFMNGLGGRSLTIFDPRALPFEDAMVTAVISTFEIGSAPDAIRVAHATSPCMLECLEVGESVERAILVGSERWSSALRREDASRQARRIGSAFRVSRGQVTGANDFFVMSRAQAIKRGIASFCKPVVSSAEEIFRADGVVRDNPQRCVALEIPKETDLSKHKALAAYISAGESAKVHERYVTSRRKPWYSMILPRPPVIGTYMARQAPTFARNPDGLGLLNIAHGLYPHRNLDHKTLARVVRGLNAARNSFVGLGRTYHGGLEKFEPREMENLPLNTMT